MLVAQLCPTFCNPMDCSPPGSFPWNSPGKNTEWVAMPSSRGASWPGDWTQVSWNCRQVLYCLSHQGSLKWTYIHVKCFMLAAIIQNEHETKQSCTWPWGPYNDESLSCLLFPAGCQPPLQFCISDPLWPFLIPPTSCLLSTLKTPRPSSTPHIMGLSQSSQQPAFSWLGFRGKVLQKVMNGRLPHVPRNVYTVKGVETVPALVQSWCGAEKGKGDKLKLIISFPCWKDNPEQAVRALTRWPQSENRHASRGIHIGIPKRCIWFFKELGNF